MAADEIVLDDLPDYIQASMEVRARWVDSVTNGGYEFVASDLTAWPLARPVRVAFRGGTDQLRKDIEEATSVITAACGLKLEFRKADGSFHEWSPADQEHAGEIRVGFELPGFFSLVGQDSVSPETGPSDQPVGGRPGQCSLNLGRFTTDRPTKWKGVVRHEFLHALGFRHEHQNMRGPCEGEFRWEDDPGYTPTTGPNGSFVEDAAGKRPGIYTYLAGPPNRWSRAKVEHNLRTTEDAAAIASSFDPASVMLYRFPALFYKTNPCSCAPSGDGEDLSEGDKRGLRLLYPREADRAVDAIAARRDGLLSSLGNGAPEGVDNGLEAAPLASEAPFIEQTRRMLRATLGG